jgi:hypothetical protein
LIIDPKALFGGVSAGLPRLELCKEENLINERLSFRGIMAKWNGDGFKKES